MIVKIFHKYFLNKIKKFLEICLSLGLPLKILTLSQFTDQIKFANPCKLRFKNRRI